LATSRIPVHLDLSGLTFIDSSGLGVLVRHARDSRRNGWTLQVGRDGLQRQVQRVIELIGADEILWPPD
jgi:anti-anti-sigma factor